MMLAAVTGANGQVGASLLARLQGEQDIHCAALIRRPEPLPADEIVADWLASERAKEVLSQADCVVHLAGALAPDGGDYEAANTAPCQIVADAVKDARRAAGIIFLSYVGASEGSENAYLWTKAVCERMVQAASDRAIVFRCTHIIGPPSLPGPTAQHLVSKDGAPVNVLGTGRQIVAPIFVGDVVEAIVAALRRPKPGTYDLAGPDTMTMDELVQALNRGREVRVRHLQRWIAHVAKRFTPRLSGPLIDVMCADSTGDSSQAIGAFGLEPTSISRAWQSPTTDSACALRLARDRIDEP